MRPVAAWRPSRTTRAAFRDVSREPARILVALCTCGGRLAGQIDLDALKRRLVRDPDVARVVVVEQACTAQGGDTLAEAAAAPGINRLLLAACHPYIFVRRLRALGRRTGIDPALMDVVDLLDPVLAAEAHGTAGQDAGVRAIGMALARLRRMVMEPEATMAVCQRALVVGGGIAGMTAALAIADRGFGVDLVEAADRLGGNLSWIHRTVDGQALAPLRDDRRCAGIEKHPGINVHLGARVTGAFGQAGRFYTTLETAEGTVQTIEHGVAILATGGNETATISAYGHGTHPAVITQKGLEQRLAAADPDIETFQSVVMIQCAGTRQEPRNYCSRVCCATAVKQALALKARQPAINIYVLYRDMMTYGFVEAHFTQARRAGVIFVPYQVAAQARWSKAPAKRAPWPSPWPIRFSAGPWSSMRTWSSWPPAWYRTCRRTWRPPTGPAVDADGFFQEADSKWRPVDSLCEGVFACGLALGPRSVEESIATAGAAAQRALRILERERLAAGRRTAVVRHALCARCERCIDACPYGARHLDADLDKIVVHPAMCQACGACAAVCPNGAAVLQGLAAGQMLEMIDQVLAR